MVFALDLVPAPGVEGLEGWTQRFYPGLGGFWGYRLLGAHGFDGLAGCWGKVGRITV